MADDPWAAFRTAPEQDPWAAFRSGPAPKTAWQELESPEGQEEMLGTPEARLAIGAARPMIGAGQVWAHKGADIAEYLGGGESMISRGGRKIGARLDEAANQFADWARRGRVAAGLGEEAELMKPSTWDVPGTIGEAISPVNLAAGGLAGRVMGGAAAGTLGRAAQGAGYGASYGVTQPVEAKDLAPLEEGGEPKTFDEAKLEQIKSGALGGAIAGPLAGVAGDIIGPRISQAARYLGDRGVRMSSGQTLGGAVNRIEQGLESIPGSGGMVTEARHLPYEDFVRAAHNETLADIRQQLPPDVPGTYAAMRHTRKAISDDYNRLHATMTTTMTPQIVTDLNRVVQNSTAELTRPEVQKLQTLIRTNVLEKFADNNGVLTGAELQAAMSKVKDLVREYRDSDKNRELGRHLNEALRVFGAARRAQNPIEAAELAGTDRAYAKSKILELAHAKNANTAYEGRFTPAQLGDATGQASSLYNKSSGTTLFQDLVQAGKQVLPNTLPNSGTSERRLIHELVLGVGGAHMAGALPHMAAGIAGTAAVYSEPTQRFIRMAIMGAPETRGPLGDFVRQYGPRVAVPLVVDALKRDAQQSAGAE